MFSATRCTILSKKPSLRQSRVLERVQRFFSGRSSKLSGDKVLIIGGGPVGSSTAFHLAKCRQNDGRRIVVVERDLTYKRASATLSAGGIRQQFSLKENIQMCLYGKDFLRNASKLLRLDGDDDIDIQFQEHGYLFLAATKAGMNQMKANHSVQTAEGCDIVLLRPEELRVRFPWLNTDDVLLGSFGQSGEGWFDPWTLTNALKNKNIEMGVNYIRGQPLSSEVDPVTGHIVSVDVEDFAIKDVVKQRVDFVVNAAGANAQNVMTLLAASPLANPLPVKPRKRCMFFFHCSLRQKDQTVPDVAPLTVDPSLVYFRSEGAPGSGNFLCGVSPLPEHDVDCRDERDLDNIDHELFNDIIWPKLYHRVPAFGDIKVKRSWAGFYEYNTVDQNAIIDFHPEMPNVLMLNGFSGHGLQQSPATGRAGAELLLHGSFQTLDLSVFGFNRLIEGGQPVFEKAIV